MCARTLLQPQLQQATAVDQRKSKEAHVDEQPKPPRKLGVASHENPYEHHDQRGDGECFEHPYRVAGRVSRR